MIYATMGFNPITEYGQDFELVEKIKSGELRVIENDRLGELLEVEKKLEIIQKILK